MKLSCPNSPKGNPTLSASMTLLLMTFLGPPLKAEQTGCSGKQYFLLRTVEHNSLDGLSVLILGLNKAASLRFLKQFCMNNSAKYKCILTLF